MLSFEMSFFTPVTYRDHLSRYVFRKPTTQYAITPMICEEKMLSPQVASHHERRHPTMQILRAIGTIFMCCLMLVTLCSRYDVRFFRSQHVSDVINHPLGQWDGWDGLRIMFVL
jgi:hypothetical protein